MWTCLLRLKRLRVRVRLKGVGHTLLLFCGVSHCNNHMLERESMSDFSDVTLKYKLGEHAHSIHIIDCLT